MQGASLIVRQVLAQQGMAAAPCCVTRLPTILAVTRLHQCSWPCSSAGAAHFSAKPEASQEQAAEAPQHQEQPSTSSSSSTSSSGDAGSSSQGAGGASSSSSGGGGAGSESSSSSSFGGFQQHFDSFRSRLGGGGSSSSSGGGEGAQQQQQAEPLGARAARLLEVVKREVADAVLPRREGVSVTRAYEGPRYEASDAAYEGPTALAAVKAPETYYSKLIKELHDRFGHHPLFTKLAGVKLTDNPVAAKASQLADDLREKYETSDHPAVHKVEDVKEKLFGMSETAAAMAKIRGRDPLFDMSKLLEGVRCDAPVVVKAFMERDMPTLSRHIGPELVERMGGMFKHFEALDQFEDPTILFVGEPELVELKLVEEEPLVVVQFACQQIKCTRDKFGNVVDGNPNSIQRVFYFWGLQQEEAGVVLPNGKVLPPRWVIKDMMWQGHLALV